MALRLSLIFLVSTFMKTSETLVIEMAQLLSCVCLPDELSSCYYLTIRIRQGPCKSHTHSLLSARFSFGYRIKRTVTDLALYIHHKMIKNYTYCFFSLTEDTFCPSKAEASIKPGEEIFLIGSFKIPVFKFESKLLVSYYLYSFNFEDYLLKGTLDLSVTDLAAQKHFSFEQDFRDLMAVKALKIETKITVKTKEVSPNLIETLLLSKLNFKQIKNLDEKFFYCDSAFLMEVFILIKEVSSESTTWKMNWYTSDNNQIYFLVNALYDLLPDNTSILPEENQADTSY